MTDDADSAQSDAESRFDRLAAKGREMAESGDGDANDRPALSNLSDEQQLAFYGAMFAMSAVDDEIDRQELFAIFELLDGDALSAKAQEELRGYAVDPPDLDECLDKLAGADAALRYTAMINLVEVTLADEVVVDAEDVALDRAQETLDVDDEERDEIEAFVEKMRSIDR